MFLISYGICAAFKRPDTDAPANSNPAPPSTADIFEMLLLSMRTVNPERRHPELVSATGLGADVPVPAAILERAKVISCLDNPGHQAGAARNIRESLIHARAAGYGELLHCGGDVVPHGPTVIEDELRLLQTSGADYVAARWGPQENGVGTQCFVCRTAAFFDIRGECLVKPAEAGPTLEYYMGGLIAKHGLKFLPHAMSYRHIHDLALFRAAAEQFFKAIGRTA
jgi:hypothetical protein